MRGWVPFVSGMASSWPVALSVMLWAGCFWAVKLGWVLTTNALITTVLLGLFAFAILMSTFRWFCVAVAVGSGTAAALFPFVFNGIVYRGGVWLVGALVVACLAWIWGAAFPPAWGPAKLEPLGSMLPKSNRRGVALGIAGVLIVTAAGGWIGSTLYARLLGPTHPEFTRTIVDNGLVGWVWVGNVSTTTAEIKAQLHGDEGSGSDIVVKVFPVGQPSSASPVPAEVLLNRVATFELDGLSPNTAYAYQIVASSDDVATEIEPTGEFTTFPDGASSFTLAFGSCARSGSNGAVFETIAAQDPLLYVMAGDLHYQNIGANDQELFDDAYSRTLSQPAQAQLYSSTPVAYI